jgi:hypothetical protein
MVSHLFSFLRYLYAREDLRSIGWPPTTDLYLFESQMNAFLEFCSSLQRIYDCILVQATEPMRVNSLHKFCKDEKLLFSKLVREGTQLCSHLSFVMYEMKKENFQNIYEFLIRISLRFLETGYISKKNSKKGFEIDLF